MASSPVSPWLCHGHGLSLCPWDLGWVWAPAESWNGPGWWGILELTWFQPQFSDSWCLKGGICFDPLAALMGLGGAGKGWEVLVRVATRAGHCPSTEQLSLTAPSVFPAVVSLCFTSLFAFPFRGCSAVSSLPGAGPETAPRKWNLARELAIEMI